MATFNASTIITSLADHAPYYYKFRKIHRFLVKITYPYIFFISFIGLITNMLTVILLSKNKVTKNLKNKWTLIALALSDLLFNSVLLIRGIHDIMKIKSDRVCLAISFLSHLAELLSAFYTVSFTIQRYYAIRCPFEAAVRRRSSPIISSLIIFILSSMFCFGISYYNPYEECHEELYLSWFVADALFSFVIPFLLILIVNALIVNYIRTHSYLPISNQSSFFSKNQTTNLDDSYETDQNTRTIQSSIYSQTEGQENIEMKLSNDTDQQINRTSVTSSLKRVNSEILSTTRQSRRKTLSRQRSYPRKQVSLDSYPPHRIFQKSISSQSPENLSIGKASTRASQSIRVTRMLVLVSTCFLILNAPGHICIIILKIYVDFYNKPSNEQHIINNDIHIMENFTSNNGMIEQTTTNDQLAIHILYTAVLFTQLLTYASYSINFFLYSFSGIAFRTSLQQLMKKFRRR